MPKRILFVCLGNICRSPMAEGVLRQRVAVAGLDWRVDSAGTGDWHVGDPPHGPAIRAAAARGYDIAGQRARQVRAADFDLFDVILAMDTSNIETLRARRPDGAGTVPRLLLDHAQGTGRTEVPDPYFTGDFEEALDLIEAGIDGLIADPAGPGGR